MPLIGQVVQPWRRSWEQLGHWGSLVSAAAANRHRTVLKSDAGEHENDEEKMKLKTVATEISQIVRNIWGNRRVRFKLEERRSKKLDPK